MERPTDGWTERERETHTHTQRHRHRHTHTHTHRDTQTHRHTDTQTHRHTDTQTQRHTHTRTHPHTHTPTHTHTHTNGEMRACASSHFANGSAGISIWGHSSSNSQVPTRVLEVFHAGFGISGIPGSYRFEHGFWFWGVQYNYLGKKKIRDAIAKCSKPLCWLVLHARASFRGLGCRALGSRVVGVEGLE